MTQELKKNFTKNLANLKKDPRGFQVFQEPIFESGTHPENFIDYECSFAADHIRRANPKMNLQQILILTIGRLRHIFRPDTCAGHGPRAIRSAVDPVDGGSSRDVLGDALSVCQPGAAPFFVSCDG